MSHLQDLSLREQASGVASGEIDAAELLAATFARMDERDGALNSVVDRFPDEAERMLAEAAADAAAVRERAHAEARGVVAEARADAVHIVATTPRRPSADADDLVVRAERLRAELDRLGASERRCREQLQAWLDDSDRLLDQRSLPAGPELVPDHARRDVGTSVRRVVTTLPMRAVR